MVAAVSLPLTVLQETCPTMMLCEFLRQGGVSETIDTRRCAHAAAYPAEPAAASAATAGPAAKRCEQLLECRRC